MRRLVRLKLRGCPFWNLPPIRLNERNDTSPLLDVDLLSEPQRNVIEKSVLSGEILILSPDGERIQGGLAHVNIVDGNHVDHLLDDVDEDDSIPDIMSVTVSPDEPEEDEEEEETIVQRSEEEKLKLTNEANIMLGRNGNTIKKMLAALEKTDYNLALLHECLAIETANKNRSGILFMIQQMISEY